MATDSLLRMLWAVPKRLLLSLSLLLALPLGVVAANGTSEKSEGPWLSTISPDGERSTTQIEPGQVAYQVTGATGTTTMVVDGLLEENVIVELTGTPLGPQSRGLARGGRPKAATIQALTRAAVALDAQHARIAQRIDELAARGDKARGAARPARIRHHYKNALNGLALSAPSWLVDELRRDPDVVGVWPDVSVQANLAESVALIGATELHAQGLTGEGVVVGIIDTGIDYRHPDLGGGFGPGFKVIGGHDFVNRDGDPLDDSGHGTHVAGIVAGSGTLSGVAPGASLVAYKVLNAAGRGSASNIIAAIDRSTNPDGDPTTADALDVINLSLGGSGHADDAMSRAIDNASAAGVLPVVAAGNSGPAYQTIGSPGTARRALTVGATDKLDRLAAFSSRGPSAVTFGLKPEVCAPGVSILSTVPNGGSALLSGTSMAAPHVAGAAALLLEGRPHLTPDQVKSFLMTSARDLGKDLFSQGTGRIDVAAAAQRTMVVSPAAIGFGIDDPSQPFFAKSATIQVTNLGGAPHVFNVSVMNTGLPAGITVTVAPPTLALEPGATGTVGVALHVDNNVVPILREDPLAHAGRLRIRSEIEDAQVPFTFLRPAILNLSFDRVPSILVVRNTATGRTWIERPTGKQHTLLLAPGTFDAYATFFTAPGPGRLRYATVVREGVSVSTVTNVDLRAADAVHLVTAAPVDERGQPAAWGADRAAVLRRAGAPLVLSAGFLGFPGTFEFAYSPLSSEHLLDWLFTSEPPAEPARSYSFFWHRAGIQTSETLTNLASELTDLTFRVDADPGTTAVDVVRWNTGVSSQQADATGSRVSLGAPFVWSRMVMPKPSGDSHFGYVEHDVYKKGTRDLLHKTPQFQAGDGTTTVSVLDGIPGRGFVATPLYDTTRTTFDIGLEPNSWWGRFVNNPTLVKIVPAFGIEPWWYFVGQTMDKHGAGQLPYTLRQGDTVIRTGSFSGAGRSFPALPVTPGRYTVDIQGPAGTLDGQPTATSVTATFDTSAADPNPPTLSHFRIVTSDDVPTNNLCLTERAEVRFRVLDDTALDQVRFSFRFAGHSQWVWWPLQVDGPDHVARLPLGAGNAPSLCQGATKAMPIELRIVATDAQGNSLETELTPAYVRRVPHRHLAPLSLDTP